MANHPAIGERRVTRRGPTDARVEPDQLAVEAPLELRVRGEPAVVLMRTPGDDEELITGYLFSEGLATSIDTLGPFVPASEPRAGAAAGDVWGDVIDLPTAELARDPRQSRSQYSSASCGACGKLDLGELATDAAPLRSPFTAGAGIVAQLPGRLRAAQAAFAETGAVHAAGLFSAGGELLAVREDVGRHNAVDKLIGWAARAGALPMAEAILCVSGRVSFEIVQKAIVAGIPIVAAVSAPTTLAVDLAERYRVTLCGFVRDGRFNVYAHPTRVR